MSKSTDTPQTDTRSEMDAFDSRPPPRPPFSWPDFLRSMRPVIILVLFIAVWMTLDLLWLLDSRAGQSRNIDEAGYYSMALNDYFGALRGGPAGWIETVLYPGIQAPLTSALSSLVFLFVGPRFGAAIVLIVVLAGIVLALTVALASRFGRPAIVWMSLLLMATTPGFLHMSRLFVFAVPATAATLAAIYALSRSRYMASLPWALAFGLFVGLMPLARTMAVAFIPGLALAVLIHLIARRAERGRRIRNTVLAAALAICVGALWLVPSWTPVFEYLTSYGYGAHTAEYARTSTSLFAGIVLSITSTVLLPHFVLILAGWGVAVAVLIRSIRQRGFSTAMSAAISSPVFAPAVFVAVGCLALASSPNAGFGFALPLIPPATVVAAWGIWNLAPLVRRIWVRNLIAGVIVLGLFAPSSVPLSGSSLPEATLTIAGIGDIPVIETPDLDPAYLLPRTSGNDDRQDGADWATANAALTDEILASGTRQETVFGFRNKFMNVNTVQEGVLERLHYGLAVAQIDPILMDGSEADYFEWLSTGEASGMCWLAMSPGDTDEFLPASNSVTLQQAADRAGFMPRWSNNLPDGRVVTLLRRAGHNC